MEVKFNNVDFSYKKVNYIEKKILNDINIKFIEGKINGIIGKSGSGKTTLIELIDSLLLPTSGNIEVGNYIINNKKTKNELDLRREIGLVFQFAEEQFFTNTIRDELETILKLSNYKKNDIGKRIVDSLKMVGLNETYLYLNPLKLSRGEMKKVAIAASLLLNPKLLILDEPTIGLDSKSKKDLIRLIRMLKNRYNKTIIIVTHDMNFLHQIVDYIFVLDNKKIVLEGTKYDIFKEEKLLKKYNIKVPKIIEFENKVINKKNIKIGYRDDINDLIKDIYRNVK